MKAVILNASPRKHGHLSQLLDILQEELRPTCDITYFHTNDLHVRHCIGCMQCRSKHQCVLHEDDAQRVLQAIEEAEILIVGSPCYWGNINGYLKVLFDRIVYGMMGENERGIPQPLHKGKCAAIVTTSTTPFPFNILFKQTRGVVNALREILKWSGFKIVGTIERGGTKKHPEVTEREKKRCKKLAQKIIRKSQR